MKRYLKTIPSDEALRLIMEHVKPGGEEESLPVHACLGRVTARPVYANVSNPPFLCSAMDGFAVLHENTLGADLANPLVLTGDSEAFPVNTGDILPHGTDAVIMVEDAEVVRRCDHNTKTRVSLAEHTDGRRGRHREGYAPAGEPHHNRIRYRHDHIRRHNWLAVRRRPRVLIIPTGKELIDIFKDTHVNPAAGLIDFNSYTLTSLAAESGCDPVVSHIVTTRDDLLEMVKTGSAGYDLILINAGSSAGTEDFTGSVVGEAGEVIFHGVSMMPGKPLLFGVVGQTPVFGIPGYPVSAVLTFMRFVRPVCEEFLGVKFYTRTVPCTAAYKIPSRIGIEEIIRVNLVSNRGRYHRDTPAEGRKHFLIDGTGGRSYPYSRAQGGVRSG